jgi:hypothetical protein
MVKLGALNSIPMLFGYNTFRVKGAFELLHYRFLPRILSIILRIIPIQSVWWIKLIGASGFSRFSRPAKTESDFYLRQLNPKTQYCSFKRLFPQNTFYYSIVFHLQNQGLVLFLRSLDHYHPQTEVELMKGCFQWSISINGIKISILLTKFSLLIPLNLGGISIKAALKNPRLTRNTVISRY